MTVLPTTLPYEKRAQPQQITVKLVSLQQPAPQYQIELTLQADDLPPRVLCAASCDGLCTFNLVPLPPGDADALSLRVSAWFDTGLVSGRAADRQLKVGAEPVMLANVRRIDFAPDGTATVVTAQRTLSGVLTGLDELRVTVGGDTLRPHWTQAQRLTVTAADQSARSLRYLAKITLQNETVAQATGAITFTTAAPPTPGANDGVAEALALPPELWKLIADGLSAKAQRQTREHGGGFSMRTPYSDIPEEGGILVGFNYALGAFFQQDDMVDALQPIYLTAHGERLGAMQGTAASELHQVRAQPGYVVTGICIRAGGNFEGFSLTFTRLEGGQLNPNDTRQSPWVGGRSGGSERTIDTNGGLVVGIAGKKAEKFGSLSLVVLPLNAHP